MYKKKGDKILYAECWNNNGILFEHLGIIGDKGETIKSKCKNERKAYKSFIKKYMAQGYNEIKHEEMFWIVLQWPMDENCGNLLKLKDIVVGTLNEELGWRGLGEIDGYDIGEQIRPDKYKKEVLNIFCYVVDISTAVKIILFALNGRVNCTALKIATRSNIENSEYALYFSKDKISTKFYI
ncbi:MAG: hypothetical protein LBE13_21905 [Bacteroidales bacterium]|nr:hypothetical protein [Bacteroidales bacterium]